MMLVNKHVHGPEQYVNTNLYFRSGLMIAGNLSVAENPIMEEGRVIKQLEFIPLFARHCFDEHLMKTLDEMQHKATYAEDQFRNKYEVCLTGISASLGTNDVRFDLDIAKFSNSTDPQCA